MRSLFLLLVLSSAACTEFATPAVLEKATILAVTADPPIVTAGTGARLDTIVVDQSGVLTTAAVSYELIETYSGVAPLGQLVRDETGVHYVAPAEVPTLPGDAPPIDTVRVTVEGVTEVPLAALKVMGIGPTATQNPTLTSLTIGDDDGLDGAVTLRRGETRTLQVATDPPASEDARFAWYSAVGTIELYQSNPTDMVIPDDTTSGWLFVAVRDGQGGVAWRATELSIE